MSTAVILLNVVFSVSVIVSIVGLHVWAIATQRRDHPAHHAVSPRRTQVTRQIRPLEASSAAVA